MKQNIVHGAEKLCTVKPRFWNTFPAKIYVINRFFAADQNLKILHKSPRFWNKPQFWNIFAGIAKLRFYLVTGKYMTFYMMAYTLVFIILV